MITSVISNNEKETEYAGELLGRRLTSGCVVALFGELGAGKTAFIRGMARGMGLGVPVTSPTYSIVHEYEGALPLFHFDMYRLSGPGELFDIGWEDYLSREGVCAVEWSEHIESALPGGCIRVRLMTNEQNLNLRIITTDDPGAC